MGGQQQQQVAPQVQKGWLSRWTRKQWSRHWFVLKNGSITYYRGPAAELCSFLDGVLDLSLIKHIEVPRQAEESLQMAAGVQQVHGRHQPPAPPSQQQLAHYQVNYSNQQQQQHLHNHQQETHFDFTLKMWNGEAHLLSAASAAERQSWLAAINSCTSFEDETATSDSSTSSDGSSCVSNLSARSTDIGATAVATKSSGPAAAVNSFQAQQQQQREADLSLEQLALKLKSVVRRTRRGGCGDDQADETEVDGKQRASQLQSIAAIAVAPVAPPRQRPFAHDVDRNDDEDADEDEHDEIYSDDDDDHDHDHDHDDDDDDDEDKDEDEDDEESDETVESSGLDGEAADGNEQMEHDEESAGQQRARKVDAPQRHTDEDEMLSIKSYSSSTSSVELAGDVALEPQRTGQPEGERAREPEKSRAPAGPRQKKRVTFDLSNQDVSKYSASSSEASASEDGGSLCSSADEEAGERGPKVAPSALRPAGSPPLSCSVSSLSSSSSDDDDEQQAEDEVTSSSRTGRRAAASEPDKHAPSTALLDFELIKRIEARRKLELKRQLSYSRQRENDEDEDSTCELVRRMIERRKLRLMNRTGAGNSVDADGDATMTAASVSGSSSPSSGASCAMETSEIGARELALKCHNEPLASSTSREASAGELSSSEPLGGGGGGLDKRTEADMQLKQLEHISQLEERLKSAQFNIELLERRLSESYLNYNQLENSYKQLQCQLLECQQLQSNNLLQTQRKIDELTEELKSSEVKLFEARERLIKYEEHLAKWQLSQQQQLNHQHHHHHQQQQQQQQPHSTSNSPPAPLRPDRTAAVAEDNRRAPSKQTSQKHQDSLTQQQRLAAKTLACKASWLLKNSLASTNHLSNADSPHDHHHQPLFLMHHLKQSLSINQQQLSLKLLSQSKQIQRKLNELELKVDKIQNNSGVQCAASNTTNNNNCGHSACSPSGSMTNIEQIASPAEQSRAADANQLQISSS